jgi:hypothetical protein
MGWYVNSSRLVIGSQTLTDMVLDVPSRSQSSPKPTEEASVFGESGRSI